MDGVKNTVNTEKPAARTARPLHPAISSVVILLLTAVGALLIALAGECFALMISASAPGDLTIGATFLFLISGALFLLTEGVGAGFLACLFRQKPSSFLPHLLPLAAYAVAIFLIKAVFGVWMPVGAVGAVLFYLSGFLLYKARERGESKTTAVLWASVPAMILSAGLLVYLMLQATGFKGSFFSEFIGSLQSRWASAAESRARASFALWNAGGGMRELLVALGYMSNAVTDEELIGYYAEYLRLMLNTILYFIPAALVAVCNVAGYIAASMLALSYKRAGAKGRWDLTASLPALLIFLAAALVNAFVYPLTGLNIFVLIMLNLFGVYMPQMLALGMQTLTRFGKKNISEHKIMFIFLIVLLVISPLFTLSGIGVYSKLMERFVRRMAKFKDDGPGDGEA